MIIHSRISLFRLAMKSLTRWPHISWTLESVGSPSDALKAPLEKWLGPSKK